MTDTAVLRQVLQPAIVVPLDDHYNRKKLVLREKQANDSCVEIYNVPEDSIVIDLDRAFSNQGLFRGSQGECKRADYVLISETEQTVLFIELKQGTKERTEIIGQLRGALCVFEYCQVIAREFFHEPAFLRHYQQRFVAFKHTSSRQRKTVIERGVAVHATPEQALMVSNARSVQFKQMAA